MRIRYIFLFLLICFYQKNTALAQLVTDNAFLAGKWLQVCIAPNGSWGNTVTVPAGYTTRGGSSLSYSDPILGTTPSGDGMDFSYDQGHDGWTVGTPPWYGAYFLPGTPFNGWQVEIDDTMAAAFYSSGLSRQFDTSEGGNFGGTVTGWSGPTCWNPQAPNTGTWQGTYGLRRPGLRNALQITAINEVDSFASWCNVTVKFKNTSDSTLHGVFYMASGDPDNDEDLPGGSFPTNNHVAYQGGLYDRHEVWGRPPSIHQDAFSGLATQDCRAKVFIYQSWPPAVTPGNNLNRVWAGTTTSMGGVYYPLGSSTLSQDIAYGIVFNVGDLAPGDSNYISYAWIFSDTNAVDSIFLAEPQLSAVGKVASSTQIDSVFGCDLTGCNVTGLFTFDADIINADTRKWTYSSWSWSPSIGLSTTSGTHVSIDIAALTGATEYTITGTPSTTRGSCTPPPPITLHLFVQPCFFATNNSAICVYDTLKLFAHGDSTNATYLWYGPVGYTSTTQNTIRTGMTMADSGIYTVVRTVGTSHDTATTHVTLIPQPVVTATNNSPVCSGPPNTLTLNVSPDSVGETFVWSGPVGFTSTLFNPSISGPYMPSGGTYKVVATFHGCMDSTTTNAVVDSTPAVPTMSSNAPICSHRDSLVFHANDATAGVSYAWRGPLAFASPLQNPVVHADVPLGASGTYSVTATLGMCKSTNSMTVTIDKTPDAPTLSSNAPICSGTMLMLIASSDPGSSFSWRGPNFFASAISNPTIYPAYTSATGVYSVTATLAYTGIAAGCLSDTATMSVIIDSTVTASFNYAVRYGCTADTVDYTNTSLIATDFKWVFGDGITSLEKNPKHVYTSQGVYTVAMMSSQGVCRAEDTDVVDLVHPLHAAFGADPTLICQNSLVTFTDSSVATTRNNILPSYVWYFGDGGSTIVPSPAYKYNRSGVYNAIEIVSDFVPCHDTAYRTITVDSISSVQVDITDTAMCTGDVATYHGIYTDIGNTGIIWDFGNGDTILNMNPLKFAYKAPGSFTVTATALYRVCPSFSSSRDIYVGQAPQLYLGQDTTICKGSTALVLKDALNAGKGARWKWSTGETGDHIQVVAPGTYYATVTMDGCSASDTLIVKNDCYINLPNVFTPNGDGMNDYFFPRQLLTSGLVSFSMNIYNRWGELIFQTTTLDGQGWDGKFNGVPQPSGVFVYIIDAVFKDGQKEHHQGNVTLLR